MFEYTQIGYINAKAWLVSLNDNYSSDGWSVIQYANDKYERLNKE